VKVIDGHHRYHGALAAIAMGHDIVRLECKDFVGSEADKIAFMVTSSQGLALTPLERGAAYHRLQNQGWSRQKLPQKLSAQSPISFSISSFMNAPRISKSWFAMAQ
jgi:ParB family chromosome partitioning protein